MKPPFFRRSTRRPRSPSSALFLRLGMVLGLLLGITPVRADNLQPSSTEAYHAADPEQAAPGDDHASPQSAQRRRERGELVFKDQVTPRWFHNNTRFWYRNELRGGAKEFVLVDA